MPSDYLTPVFNNQYRIVPEVIALVNKLKPNALAFRGYSGSSIGCIVSYLTGIPAIYVRKEYDKEPTHGTSIEASANYLNLGSYVIIDDFISSGRTVDAIMEALEPRHLLCTGIILYYAQYRKPDKYYNNVPIYYTEWKELV